MIPVYFTNKEEREFKRGGTLFSECTYCHVKWSKEGLYEAELHYPYINSKYQLELEQWFLLKPYDAGKCQPFYIYKIDYKSSGEAFVYLRHFSYLLINIPFSEKHVKMESISDFISTVTYSQNGNIIIYDGAHSVYRMLLSDFEFEPIGLGDTSDIEFPKDVYIKLSLPPINYRQYLLEDSNPNHVERKNKKGKVEEEYDEFTTIKGIWPFFDILFDGKKVKYGRINYDFGDKIEYGVNMLDFSLSVGLEEYYDGIVPYYEDGKAERTIRALPALFNSDEYLNDVKKPVNHRYNPIDLSSYYDWEKTVPVNYIGLMTQMALEKSQNIQKNFDKPWIPKEKLSVSFVPGTVVAHPYNNVVINHKILNYTKKGRIVAIEYNVLEDIVISATVSDFKDI